MSAVYSRSIKHSCDPPLRVVKVPEGSDFPAEFYVDIDHLPDGRRLTEGMRWRCPICYALWGAERPAANVFAPQWMKLSSGFWWRLSRAFRRRTSVPAQETEARSDAES